MQIISYLLEEGDEVMKFTINRFVKGQLEETATWDGLPFEAGKAHAEELIQTGVADRVEIRDEAGQLIFHLPRVVRPA
jgi:hypothetical protein